MLKNTPTQKNWNLYRFYTYGYYVAQLQGFIGALQLEKNDKELKDIEVQLASLFNFFELNKVLHKNKDEEGKSLDDYILALSKTLEEMVYNEEDLNRIIIAESYILKVLPIGKYKVNSVEGLNLITLILMKSLFYLRGVIFSDAVVLHVKTVVKTLNRKMEAYYEKNYNPDVELLFESYIAYIEDVVAQTKIALIQDLKEAKAKKPKNKYAKIL